MTCATFTIAAVAFVCLAAAPPVRFESPCSCRGAHGKARLALKNDPAIPPGNANAIQAVTPSDIYSWPGPDVQLTGRFGNASAYPQLLQLLTRRCNSYVTILAE